MIEVRHSPLGPWPGTGGQAQDGDSIEEDAETRQAAGMSQPLNLPMENWGSFRG